MPEATRPDTSPPRAPEPLPAVFDLGRHLAGLWDRLNHNDEILTEAPERSDAYRQAESAAAAISSEINAMEALIFARPIKSLADGAALAVCAFRLADYLGAIDADMSDCREEIKQLATTTARLSFLLTEAAGLPPELLMGPDGVAFIARRAAAEARP